MRWDMVASGNMPYLQTILTKAPATPDARGGGGGGGVCVCVCVVVVMVMMVMMMVVVVVMVMVVMIMRRLKQITMIKMTSRKSNALLVE